MSSKLRPIYVRLTLTGLASTDLAQAEEAWKNSQICESKVFSGFVASQATSVNEPGDYFENLRCLEHAPYSYHRNPHSGGVHSELNS